MNECGVCGILYLAGGSCPACGSQIQKRSDDFQDADMVLPTEVPGLDDAADAWYDLEGIEPPVEEEKTSASSLPFGFGGESLTNVSRLPFGIGSHRDGIPFDVAQTIEPPVEIETEETEIVDPAPIAEEVPDVPEVASEEPEAELPKTPAIETEVPVEDSSPEPIRITAIPLPVTAEPVVVQPEIPVDTTSVEDIYSPEDDVVEVVFSDLEDTVVHVEHTFDEATSQPQVVEYAEKTFTPFDLHPARAMTVQSTNDPALKTLVEDGFMAIGKGDWRNSARAFQRVLASVPDDVGAMNNYGISLLQVATNMQESNDPVDVSNAATQFEAAILSLREAVRTNPEGEEPLYNLMQALLLSGREEKALSLMNMVADEHKSQSHFTNLHAAILAQLGQYGEAKSILAPIQGEPLISQNLLKLPSL